MKRHRLLSELAAIDQQLTQMVSGPRVFSMEQPGTGTWSPPVDIYETPVSFVLTAEVPGVQSGEIDIKVIDGNLILRGERRWEREDTGENFHRLESSYGKFERSFSLSERIDAENISAELRRGILTVILPKRADAGRKIDINTEG
ncbi:MAG: Hsp20/alpha crystallin family protein [Blastocatellia bacterium]